MATEGKVSVDIDHNYAAIKEALQSLKGKSVHPNELAIIQCHALLAILERVENIEFELGTIREEAEGHAETD